MSELHTKAIYHLARGGTVEDLVNLVLEAAAESLRKRRETIQRVMDVQGDDEDTFNVQAYAAHQLLEAETAISAMKETSK